MHVPGAPFRRLFALSLLAWAGMLFAQSPAWLSMRVGMDAPAMHAAPSHPNTGAVMHVDAAMAEHAPCCGHGDHAAGSCHGGGCAGACTAAVLPPRATDACAVSSSRESVWPGYSRLAAMITAPPLRPPAV